MISPILSTDDMKECRSMQKHDFPTVTASKIDYECPYLKVRHDVLALPNGIIANYYIVMKPNASGIIAIRDGKVLLVKQYRHPIAAVTYEFPMGMLDGDEEAITSAMRELAEETGFTTDTLKPLGALYPQQGTCNTSLSLFVAENLKNTEGEKDIEEYDLESVWVTFDEMDQMIRDGRINTSQTIAGWYQYKLSLAA